MLSNQKGFALIIVLMMTIVLFFIGAAALTMGSSVRKTAGLETEQKKAYYIAEAGIEKAIDIVKRENDWVENLVTGSEYNLVPSVIPSDYADGALIHVKVQKESFNDSKTTLSIKSKGRYHDVYRQIEVRVDLGKPMAFYRGIWTDSPPGAPSSFKNNSVVESDLTVNGNILFWNNCVITKDVWVGGNVTIASNMSVNPRNLYAGGSVIIENNGQVVGNVQAGGSVLLNNNAGVGGEIKSMGSVTLENNAVVSGDIWAKGDINNYSTKVEGNLYPNQKDMDLQFTLPPFPTIDLDWYRKNADYYYSGSQTWNGDLNLNGLFFVDGDLSIQGTYTGVGTVVVSGTVTFEGNLACVDIEQDDLCILSADNVTLDNEVQVRALIYSPATVTINNKAIMRGSVIARTLIQDNNAKLYYEPKLQDNQPDWVTTSLQILSWEEK